MRRFPRLVLPIVALALVLPNAAAGDEWLTFRRDAQRTAASTGRASIDRPTVRFRRYLGGQLASTQHFALDADGDGVVEVVYVAGGRAIAKRPDNLILWESPLLALTYLVGASDLDGDGADEIVAAAQAGRVFVLSGRDGSVLWQNPEGPIGTVGAVRVADLDGDGRDDLYIAECRCCTIHGSSRGVAYEFTGGFAGATQLWTLSGVGGCGANDQIADVDGDGFNEIVIANQQTVMNIVDARTGAVRVNVPAPASGSFYPSSTIYPIDLDGDAAREIVVVSNGYLASGSYGARRIAVWDAGGDGSFTLLWQVDAASVVSDAVSSVPDAMGDLDGDGTAEVAFGIVEAGASRIEVRAAISGELVATLPGAALAGAVDLDADGRAELLVRMGGSIGAYQLRSGALSPLWTLADRSFVTYVDHERWPADANAIVPLALNLDDDAALELIVTGSDGEGRSALWAIDASGATPTELGRFSAEPGVSVLTAARAHGLTRPYEQVMTVTSDGYLIVLDRRMGATNRVLGEIPLPGMRVGGYYSGASALGHTAYVADLGAPSIVVRDSRPALVRLDARTATLRAPPTITWERFGAQFPVIADLDGDGTRDIAVQEGGAVVALDAESARTELWRAAGALAEGPYSDLLPARRPGGVDVMFSRAQAGAVMEGVMLAGTTGALRWTPFSRALSWGYITPAVGDVTGDGIDDLVTVTNSATVIDGASGGVVNDNGAFLAYALPMLADFDGDDVTDAWVHGGYFPDRLVSGAMVTRSVRADHTTPNTGSWGALVECGGEPAVVAGTFESAHLFTVRPRDAAPLARRVLIDGAVYDPGAEPEGRRGGFLGNVTAVRELSTTRGPAVLVGSTDGHLYALDPCKLALHWSLELRYPVGEPVVADATGDGVDDVLVSCADGFLYGIGEASLDAPMEVRDVDPSSATPMADVDEIDSLSTLHAWWTPVPGATSYEVGVFSSSGTEARFPNYQDVGNVTQVDLYELPLRQGQRYYVSVIPVGPAGPGLEGRSDGVTITDRDGPSASVTVSPSPAWPAGGVTPAITITCTDRVGVSGYRVVISDGATVRMLAEGVASGTSFSESLSWDGIDDASNPSPAGRYTAVATCTDLHGRTASAEADLVLDPSASMADGGRPLDGGVDGGVGGGGGGCGCRAAGPSRLGGSLALFAIALALWRRR